MKQQELSCSAAKSLNENKHCEKLAVSIKLNLCVPFVVI